MLDVKEWINKVTNFIKTKRYAIVYHGTTDVEMVLVNQTVTSKPVANTSVRIILTWFKAV